MTEVSIILNDADREMMIMLNPAESWLLNSKKSCIILWTAGCLVLAKSQYNCQ